MIKINEKDWITNINEMTIGQFEQVMAIINKEEHRFVVDKYIKIFKILGATDMDIQNLSDDQFFQIIKAYDINGEEIDQLPRTIELDGYRYAAYEEGKEVKLGLSGLAKIEKAMAERDFYSYLLAILFKREDQSTGDHWRDYNISARRKRFKDLPAHTYFSWIQWVAEKIKTNIEFINDKSTEATK
jgi:hypothetical protein